MKCVLFLLTINFLVIQCPADFFFSDQLFSFISYFGVSPNSPRYEEIQPDTDVEAERIHDPLYLLLVSFDRKTTMGIIRNPMFLGQYINSGIFVDFLLTCPKKDENKTTTVKKTENSSEWAMRTLVIEKSYTSMVKNYEKQTHESKKEADRTDTANIQDHKISQARISSFNLEQQPEQNVISQQDKTKRFGDVPEHTPMELDLDQEKKDVANESNHPINLQANSTNSIKQEQLMQDQITPLPHQESNEDENSSTKKRIDHEDLSEPIAIENIAVPKKQKLDTVDQQKDTTDYNKMETDSDSIPKPNTNDPNGIRTDSASIQMTEVTDPHETKTFSTSQSEIENVQESVNEGNAILNNFTPKTKKYWIRAMDDAEEFKCDEPVKAHLFEYPSLSDFKFYLAGYEVFMDKHKDFEIVEFKKSSNRKYKWFWSFTIVLTKLNPEVVCVFQDVNYNEDTYRPEINDNFDNHDLGKKMMFPEMDIGQLYEIKNQEKVFRKLFANEEERKKYFDIDRGNFLVRVHLAPLHNFLTPVVRQSGKTYGNVGPMWSSIRNGAWRRLEDYIDILSHVLMELIVITGVYGTLNLDGKDVYLGADKKLPVPLAFWKMVIYGTDLDDCHGILIITYNNPHQNIDDFICEKDSCQKYGWGHIQEDNINEGRTICCKFTPKILDHIPILRGAKTAKILNLFKLSSIVDDMWEYNELGEKTTPQERDGILKKLQLDENFVDEKIIAADDEINENVENENEQKADETVSLLHKELESVFWPNKLVEI